jgi:hypothetical protein
VIREDRELLAELARLNRSMAPLAMCIMDGTASAAEQHDYALRLIAAGERLQHRADETGGTIVEGEVLANGPLTLAAHTVESPWGSLDGRQPTSDSPQTVRGCQSGPSPSTYRTPLSGGAL